MPADVIPLNDLRRRADSTLSGLRGVIDGVLSGGSYILGPQVERFESAFAAYCGTRHAVGVASGTDALELALRVLDCGSGDEVITVANAGGYATTAILHAGAVPAYADIGERHFLLTPEALQTAITPATRAVIITHLYGLMADMAALCRIAHERGIAVIEDCSQAHGASIAGKKAGSWGAFGCFSFYPTKNLGALGDAGCVTTGDDGHAARIRSLRQYGWEKEKYHSPHDIGRNSRMDALQAAILSHLLPRLDGWNERRREIVAYYRDALCHDGVMFQQVDNDESFVAHLCAVRVRNRAGLMAGLQEQGIGAAIHYPVADYDQPAVIKRVGERAPLPATQRVTAQIMSLPCFPELTAPELDRVVAALRRSLKGAGK